MCKQQTLSPASSLMLEVAHTILAQLGGARFRAMTGAKDMIGASNALTFGLPSRFASKGINKVRIALDWSDRYTVTFFRIRGIKVAEVARIEGVYADQLRDVFTRETGLAVSL